MDVKDSYLHGTVGVVKSINVTADKLSYELADIKKTIKEVTLPLATTTTNGLLSSSDYKKLRSTTLLGYGITDAVTLNTDQTITGEKTFSKLKVSNTNLVTNLNADMVGGYDSLSLFTSETIGDVNAPNKKAHGSWIAHLASNCSNVPSSCDDGKIVHFSTNPNAGTSFQLASSYYGNTLFFRSGNLTENSQYYLYNKAWKQFAFTDSDITGNAESATKLKTARKIWGQNFDGTADVSGGMTGVTSIQNSSGLSIISNGLGFAPENAGDLKGALTIGGTINFGLAIWSDGSGKSYLQSGRTDGKNAAYNLILQHLGGNVGIGTISPTEKLEVSGNIKATSFLGNLDGSYINKLTGYTKATTISAITVNDTLNAALGKLELKADTAYELVKGAYDGDGTIENLAEILKVLEGISDTDTIKSLLGKYRRLDKDEFYGSEVRSKFWIDKTIEGGGGWAYPPIQVFKADKETKLLNIGVYGNNSDLIYSYIGSNDHNSTKNLRIYPDGTVTAPVFNGNLNYTNLTGSTTTANQAIVSNGTKDGWKLQTLGSGAFQDDYPMLNLGTLSDYVEYVLLLHPIAKRNSSDNWTYYYSYGTIYTHRSNGLGPSSSITYNSIPKYGSSGPTQVYVSMMQQGRKYAQWCTCTYNGQKYCGLKLYISTNNSADLTIKGRWNSDPVLVKYKTNPHGNITSEEIIHNEEIANSIVVEGDDIIINSTYGKFNGTFVTSGGTASQFVKGDGSLDSNTYVSETEFPNLSSKGLYKILTSSGGSNINKWKKFARINLSSDIVYTQCGGYMFIYDHEGHRVKGILDFQVRTIPDTSINNSNINLQSPYLNWHILDNSSYASNIKMVKVKNGIFDLYITTLQSYTTFVIQVFTPNSDKITLFDETWIDTLPETVIATSSYTITVPNAITATKLANTLTFAAGTFATKTYDGSAAVTVNIPTHTSHLTNDSFAVHNTAVKNVTSLTHSTLGYAYNSGENADTFWYTVGPVALFGTTNYKLALQLSADKDVLKFRRITAGSYENTNWRTLIHDGNFSNYFSNYFSDYFSDKSWNKVVPYVYESPAVYYYCYKIAQLNLSATVSGIAVIELLGIGDSNYANVASAKLKISRYYQKGEKTTDGKTTHTISRKYTIGLQSDSYKECYFVAYLDSDGGVWIKCHKCEWTSSLRWRLISNGNNSNVGLITNIYDSTTAERIKTVPNNVKATARPNQFAEWSKQTVQTKSEGSAEWEETTDSESVKLGGFDTPFGSNLTTWYNDTVYNILTNNDNSNVTLNSCGGALYLGYKTTSSIQLEKPTYAKYNITASEFVKSGSSDQYVLLGGGGHKALSSITASKLTSNTIVPTFSKKLSSAEWVDTGYTFTNLATGTYAVQVTSGTNLVASGIMSIYQNLEDTKGDEIPLHVYGTAEWRPYLRTYKNKLQISSNDTSSTSRTVTIKIAQIL